MSTEKTQESLVPLYLPPVYQDSVESGRIIMRDGSTANLRLSRAEDKKEMAAFFHRITPESRWERFFSIAEPDEKLISSLCDSSNPHLKLTLVTTRIQTGKERIIAIATYWAMDKEKAEVAFSVDDLFQGKGLGTLLLERLAVLAANNGFQRFWAITHVHNNRMIEIFRNSGFQLKQKLEDGSVEVEFSVLPTRKSSEHSEMLDRVFTAASIRPLFHPTSVAVIGASRNPGSIGFRILHALHERYKGKLIAINPHATEIDSVPCFASIRDVPQNIDLAVVSVPSELVLQVVDECAEKGVRALVVITAGFAEVGKAGKELQRKLLEKVRGYGMRMVGPNCMGLINTDPGISLNASFSPIYPPAGRIAMSSQSGALGISILLSATHRNLGLSTFVSVGNKADVSGNDLLNYWEQDPATDVILLYLESFGNPRRFSRIARRVSRTKPIVCVKAGRTLGGSRAAGSHTAALASNEVAVEALFQQTGVIRAETLEEMFDLAAVLGNQPLPRGNRVGIVTNAGGPAILCTDACEAGGLKVPEFSAKLKKQLAEFLPPAGSTANPVDLVASAGTELFHRSIQLLLGSNEIDTLIVIYIPVMRSETPQYIETISEAIRSSRKSETSTKPVIVCFMSESANKPLEIGTEKIPTFMFPESAARVLAKVATYAEWKGQPQGVISDFVDADSSKARAICANAIKERGPGWLTVSETRNVLDAMKLPLPKGDVANNEEDAVIVAKSIGYPVAVKLASHTITHKSELGGVHLNLKTEEEVRNAFRKIREQIERHHSIGDMDGVLIQPMLSTGLEVIVGVTDDPLFGPLIAFGLGGVFVEILKDLVFRITPLTDLDVQQMVKGIKGYKLLQGYRGQMPVDQKAIEELLLRISRLVEEVPEISELDLNPIFALPSGQGCTIADARIHVRNR
jgi:acetyl coenzyme A synthetase (ADP forming)-like protein